MDKPTSLHRFNNYPRGNEQHNIYDHAMVLLHGYTLFIKIIILHQKKLMRSYKQQITNSQQYTNSLKQRGRLDFWMDKSIFSKWTYSGKQSQGGKVIYSDLVIELILVLSYVYSLLLRQTEGFVSSLLALNGEKLSVPDYTTVCRRRKSLDVSKKLRKWNGKENIVFSIDSSGLKCCGEKEWMQIKHRATRRRKFIKIHTGINIKTR